MHMQRVLVVDVTGRPLMPCRPARARLLCKQGKAVVRLRYPYTIMLQEARPEAVVEPLRLKLDPGAKTTGLAVVTATRGEVVWAAELAHRGEQVKHRLDQRRQRRRSRRQRKTRYRQPRWHNRRRKPGWLPPSLESRIANILTWVRRLGHWCPVGALSLERVKFDTALLADPTLVGAAYQQGTREGMEIQEYLLHKWQRRCAYCQQPSERLEVEHLIPRSRGGSDRISNLVLACHACNQAKGDQTAEEFGYGHLMAQAKSPLKDAAAVNATRWALYERLQGFGLPLETGTGGLTKWNRLQRGIPKTHWLDAACVGSSTPARLRWQEVTPLLITAMGRHSRQMCRTNDRGFPDKAPKATSVVGGFRTGDMRTSRGPAAFHQSRRVCGTARHSGDRVLQPQEAAGNDPGDPRTLLPSAASWRRLYLCYRKEGGASSPGLKPRGFRTANIDERDLRLSLQAFNTEKQVC